MGNLALPTGITALTRIICGGSILLSAIVLGNIGIAVAQQPVVPAVPAPVAVSVDPSTTALLVYDVNSAACPDTTACATVGPIATLLANARAAGALVVYSTYAANVLPGPENAPQPGEVVLVRPRRGPDQEGMDGVLQGRGIETVVFAGNSLQQAILYGSYQFSSRYGYTVVVPVDSTAGANDYRVASTLYQLLNQGSGISNPTNTPLAPRAVTLSRSDLVSFQGP